MMHAGRRLVLVSVLAASAATSLFGGQQVPTALVERHRTINDTATRITLFDNRMAVTTVRVDGKQVFFRQLSLPIEEFDVYLQVLEEVADTAQGEPQSFLEDGDSEVTISLHLQGHSPRTIRFSPLQVLGLDTNRLMVALDDLERRVAETSPSHEALRTWQPHKGDRVELFNGSKATVDEVRDDGVIVLIHDDTSIIEAVQGENASLVILRVLP